MTVESVANGIVNAIIKLLKVLTLRRIGLLALFEVIAIAGGFAWDSRDYIRGVIQPARFSVDTAPLTIDEMRTQAADKALETGPAFVSTIGIVSVNAPANSRKIIYFRSNDANVQRQYDMALASRVGVEVPLFTSNAEDNTTLFRLLNGEMVCRPWEQSISSRYLKDVNIRHVCAVGVPPGFSGRFRGIVFIYLRSAPDDAGLHRIHILLRNLSFKLDGQRPPYSDK